MDSRNIPFKVDIAGIIEIMGSSLYSRIDTPIRELIQNSHDAVLRRRNQDLSFQGRIDIRQDAVGKTISFSDDGVGLTRAEAEDYLGTLGMGITGLLKGRGTEQERAAVTGSGDELIGQFGIGLFSAFMLAEKLVVRSRRSMEHEAIEWTAGPGTDIQVKSIDRETLGTTVTLHLKPDCCVLAENDELLEDAIKQFADFLPVPIYLNDAQARTNIINVAWFDTTPDDESVELDIASYFNESPLDVIPVRIEQPVRIEGALYVSPQRTPGFSDDAVVAATIRRMVISRRVHELIPPWASFLRGVLELPECSPTASREDLVRDRQFELVQATLSRFIHEHFEKLASEQPKRLEAIINWHRFIVAGAALEEGRLRALLRDTYRFNTTHGDLTFSEIIDRSAADPLVETEADQVIWYNADRRQERWLGEIFAGHEVMCVHALRSFEELLLAHMVADTADSDVDLRIASPSSENFGDSILGMREIEEANQEWDEFLGATGAKVMLGSFRSQQPVMAFLNERYELAQTFEDLKKDGDIPKGFQRLIDSHFASTATEKNEVILNRDHRLVQRALERGTRNPLANVVRLLVLGALNSAGASITHDAHAKQSEDLDWIAEVLWGRD